MRFISSVLTREYSHFKKLSIPVQKLIISYSLYNIAYPFLSLFINAFLFTQTKSFVLVATYNIANFVGLPLGFYVTGMLLKKVSINRMYLLGCICQGLSIMPLFFIHESTLNTIIIFGILFGFSLGIFWSCRHLLSVTATNDHQRNYFESVVTSVSTISNIVVSAAMGWFIAAGGGVPPLFTRSRI